MSILNKIKGLLTKKKDAAPEPDLTPEEYINLVDESPGPEAFDFQLSFSASVLPVGDLGVMSVCVKDLMLTSGNTAGQKFIEGASIEGLRGTVGVILAAASMKTIKLPEAAFDRKTLTGEEKLQQLLDLINVSSPKRDPNTMN